MQNNTPLTAAEMQSPSIRHTNNFTMCLSSGQCVGRIINIYSMISSNS